MTVESLPKIPGRHPHAAIQSFWEKLVQNWIPSALFFVEFGMLIYFFGKRLWSKTSDVFQTFALAPTTLFESFQNLPRTANNVIPFYIALTPNARPSSAKPCSFVDHAKVWISPAFNKSLGKRRHDGKTWTDTKWLKPKNTSVKINMKAGNMKAGKMESSTCKCICDTIHFPVFNITVLQAALTAKLWQQNLAAWLHIFSWQVHRKSILVTRLPRQTELAQEVYNM